MLGNHTITVTASDAYGGATAASFTLSVLNNPPVYNGGLTDRNSLATQGVNWPLPGNAFSDANGDGLSYTVLVERPGYWQYYKRTPSETDFRWVEPAWLPGINYGMSIDGAGTITGTPGSMTLYHLDGTAPPEPRNSYRVKVVANDGAGGTAEGVFTLSVNEPQKGTPGAGSVKSSTAFSNLGAHFTDFNGDTLTYSASNLPAGAGIDPASGNLFGSVASPGVYTIYITANDGKGGTATTTYTLTVVANNNPSAPAVGNLSGTVGTGFSYTAPASTDPDYDNLTYGVSTLPPGLYFDPNSRTIYGTPTTPTSMWVNITAYDGRGGAATTSFIITINAYVPPNSAPYVNNEPASPRYSFYLTNAYYVQPEAFVLPENTFIDPDNNPLSYEILQKPAWLDYSYIPGTGHRFYGKSNDTRARSYHTIQIRATDPSGASAVVTFQVEATYEYVKPGGGGNPARVAQAFLATEETSVQAAAAPAPAQATSSAERVEESWYAYDRLNRVSIVNGNLQNGQVVLGVNDRSYGVSYDAAGNEVGHYRLRPNEAGGWTATIKQQSFSLRGELLLTFGEVPLDGTGPRNYVTERRAYDDAGRLIERIEYYAPGKVIRYVDKEGTFMTIDVSGWLLGGDRTSYDDDGRLLNRVQLIRPAGTTSRVASGGGVAATFPTWLDDTWEGDARQRTDMSLLVEGDRVSYTGPGLGYDAGGRLKGYQYITQGYTHTYSYAYEARDSYLERQVTGTSTDSNYRTTSTTTVYDAAGNQLTIRERTEGGLIDDRVRLFASDGNGQVISRRDGTTTPYALDFNQGTAAEALYRNQHFIYANGQQVGGLDKAGKLDALSRVTAFSSGDSGRSQIVVQQGDTLKSLAQRVYGNSNLWYVLAEANALSNDGGLVAGATLNVPDVTTSGNDANTFKPYNPSEVTGPTTPSLPYIQPPPSGSGGCGPLGMFIMIVVIIIVAVYVGPAVAGAAKGAMVGAAQTGSTVFATAATTTAPAALTTTGTVVAGAAGGAAGAAAGVAVGTAAGSAMGVASFSWRDVASAAIAGAVTGGFGGYADATGMSELLRAGGMGMATAAGTYAGQAASGQNPSFSWRSVAASAVTSWLTRQAAPYMSSAIGADSTFTKGIIEGITGGVVSAAVRSANGETLRKNDYVSIAADAFGNALGNKIVAGQSEVNVVYSASGMQAINEELRLAGEQQIGSQLYFASVTGLNNSDIQRQKAELSTLIEQIKADPGQVTGAMVRRFNELSGIADFEAKGIQLTDAQVNQKTWIGHMQLLPEVAVHYAGLPAPYLFVSQEQISEWRTSYEAVDAAVQNITSHNHSTLEAGEALNVTKVLSNEESYQARLRAAEEQIGRDGRELLKTAIVRPALGALGTAISPLGMSLYGFYESEQAYEAGNKKMATFIALASVLGMRASLRMPSRGVLGNETGMLLRQAASNKIAGFGAFKSFGDPVAAGPVMGSRQSQIGAVGDLDKPKVGGSTPNARAPELAGQGKIGSLADGAADSGVKSSAADVPEVLVAPGAINGVGAEAGRQSLYDYTNGAGLEGIIESKSLNPSLWRLGTKDVRYGNGQYLSDLAPGAKSPSQLSREFLGRPFHGDRFTHFVEVDVRGLGAVQGRPGVYVVPNDVPLDLTARLLSSGKVPTR